MILIEGQHNHGEIALVASIDQMSKKRTVRSVSNDGPN